jgi:hypothetical protein
MQRRHESLVPRRYAGDVKTVVRNGWTQLAASIPDERPKLNIRAAWGGAFHVNDASPLYDRLLRFMGGIR